MAATKYEINAYSSLGKIDEYNCKPTVQVVTVTVGGPSRFIAETWSDNDFATFKREGNIIKIYLSKNPHVVGRLFGIIVRDPMGEYEDEYWGLEQKGQQYKFNDEKHTFERGYTPDIPVERIRLAENELLTRVYKNGDVMTKSETREIGIDIYGGSCQGYIRGISKYRVCGENKVQFVAFDGGISATIKADEKGFDDDYCTNRLVISSNGRPFNDNDDYFYVITVGHLDTPRYYAEVEVRFDGKEDNANGNASLTDSDGNTLDETKGISFNYDGGVKLVKIDLGTDEDCDWFVSNISEDWVHINYHPLSLGIVCDPIVSVDENRDRNANVELDVNGTPLTFKVTQAALTKAEISVNYDSFVCAADDDKIEELIVTTYGTELKTIGTVIPIEIDRNGLSIRYSVILQVGVNPTNNKRDVNFTLQTDDGVTKNIKVTQLSPVVNKDPIQFAGDLYHIDVPKGDIPTAYASANWCIVTIDETPTPNGERDAYGVKYEVKPGEDNVFGITRKCKVVFTNTNNTEKPVSCIVTNETGKAVTVA